MLSFAQKPFVRKYFVGNARWHRRLLVTTFIAFFVLYGILCPALNEPLYELMAIHPVRNSSEEYPQMLMGNTVGTQVFFPVVTGKGPAVNLHGVHFKTPLANSKGVVIINPSNSYNLSNYINCKPALTLLSLGYDVFFFDYEGFGHSQGTASYKKLGTDALSAYEFVRKTYGLPIILYGMSMGTGVSSYVAARVPVTAIIYDSPFLSPEVTIKEWFPLLHIYPTQMFQEPKYDNAAYLAGKHPPVLILTKGQDCTCSPQQGITLAKLASPPSTSLFMPDSAHCYVAVSDAESYHFAIKKFLNSL